MIGYFPEPYPDELVYSLLARYCAKSGYLGYVCAAEEIFQNTWNLPNIEFLNEYKPEVYQRLEKNTGMNILCFLSMVVFFLKSAAGQHIMHCFWEREIITICFLKTNGKRMTGI